MKGGSRKADRATIRKLRTALSKGDVAGAIGQVALLNDADRRQLGRRLGEPTVRMLASGKAAPRALPTSGRVVVVPSFMGSELRSAEGTEWIDATRLSAGGFAALADVESGPAAVGGILLEYLPLLAQLHRSWDVVPFSYDWRQPLDRCAESLAAALRGVARTGPAHIVAHGAGGLVVLRTIEKHPDVWAALLDPAGLERGGRLVMLGCALGGSYTALRLLDGTDPVVSMLARLAPAKGVPGVVEALAAMPGLVELLPLPAHDEITAALAPLDPSVARGGPLRAAGLGVPVAIERLQAASATGAALARLVDPARMVLIGGFGHETPRRARVEPAGTLAFQTSRSGDGVVLCDSVVAVPEPARSELAAFWSKGRHGDLVIERPVLEALDDLLIQGQCEQLSAIPVLDGPGQLSSWRPSDDAVPLEWIVRVGQETVSSASRTALVPSEEGKSPFTPMQAGIIEAAVVHQFVGHDTSGSVTVERTVPRLTVKVWHGNLTQVNADVYAVGHYIGVPPQNAEAAIDEVISGPDRPLEDRVIRRFTQRGTLRGELGEVSFFPWALDAKKQAAIAGMGRPGRFGAVELERLAQSVALAVSVMPRVEEVATVLIGAGTGNMAITVATEAMLVGYAGGLAGWSKPRRSPVLHLVERDYVRAHEVLRTVERLAKDPRIAKRVQLDVASKLSETTGNAPDEFLPVAIAIGATALHAALVETSKQESVALRRSERADPAKDLAADIANPGSSGPTFMTRLLEVVAAMKSEKSEKGEKSEKEHKDQKGQKDEKLHTHARLAALALTLGIVDDDQKGDADELRLIGARIANAISGAIRQHESLDPGGTDRWSTATPTRISCWTHDDSTIRFSALTQSAVVAERAVATDIKILGDLASAASALRTRDVRQTAELFVRLLLPHDFQALINTRAPIVIEVDRSTAALPWELLAALDGSAGANEPIALHVPVSRQLRTTYSAPPEIDEFNAARMRALVVGDPGDPAKGETLEGAMREAKAVAVQLRESGVEVTLLLGSPGRAYGERPRDFSDEEIRPATRIAVLDQLLRGGWDILHFCGHGTFVEGDPSRCGWVFSDGLLTPPLISRVPRAPRLVVANACLSGRTAGSESAASPDGSKLLPSLADEFFRRGVRNYIGTAWPIADDAAIDFAAEFYRALLPRQIFGNAEGLAEQQGTALESRAAAAGGTIGEAILNARRHVAEFASHRAHWAAYQHYGDPQTILWRRSEVFAGTSVSKDAAAVVVAATAPPRTPSPPGRTASGRAASGRAKPEA